MKSYWKAWLGYRTQSCSVPDRRPTQVNGILVTIMPRKMPGIMPHRSTPIQDYPASISMYERESLAAEAKLKAERKKKKGAKIPQSLGNVAV